MQRKSPTVRSRGVLVSGLSLALALAAVGGCRGADDPSGNGALDLSLPSDLSAPAIQSVTIRDVNSATSNLKLGDRVRMHGVVISPRTWVTFDTTDLNWCYYRVMIMQGDGSPTTLRDGIAVTLSLKATLGDMSHITECTNLGNMDAAAMAMLAAKLGDEIEIEGKLSKRGSGATATRQIDVYKGLVTNHGTAAMMPAPLEADPANFVPLATGLAQAFADSQGLLVTFKNVKVNSRDAMYQDFSVSTTDTGGARIAANFLKVTSPMYMTPMNGTVVKSVTGIVTGDFKGTIWPRSDADIQQ